MRITPFRAVVPNMDYITSADTFFSTVKEEYPSYRKSGFFDRAPQEAIYVYQIQSAERNYSGIIACADIRDYQEGFIKKHEHTLATKEQKQIHLLLMRQAQVKPILLTYGKRPRIEAIIEQTISNSKPIRTYAFEADGKTHALWEISDGKQIQELQKLFKKNVPNTYIADGHHRSAAQSTLNIRGHEGFSHILCAFFSASELEIWDFNRVVDALEDISPTLFMAKLSKIFDIQLLEKPQKPSKKHEIVMQIGKEWYLLQWRKKVLKSYASKPVLLDVDMLNEKVLEEIIGVEDVRTDSRLKYVEGIAGWEGVREKVIKNENRIGFILYPISMDDFKAIADAELVLPPKSTWFEPRMKNGLVVKEF